MGRGTRKNQQKREYVLAHIEKVEYRTLARPTRQQAEECERQLKGNKSGYEFET